MVWLLLVVQSVCFEAYSAAGTSFAPNQPRIGGGAVTDATGDVALGLVTSVADAAFDSMLSGLFLLVRVRGDVFYFVFTGIERRALRLLLAFFEAVASLPPTF